ncbi:DUF998 domain-containing protein [Leucobacter massiliensis]|uniref:DUF998 domain-containing protein n=1 Tax=Leucobacter massiliensis TaxID=1686285 RepID=A0A2S9QPV2_9MICO|nr:DUF998 domain-containing protein [Leucobacter massiliensis]PRI11617.1 hypothetical protein B4915_05790 [Leucobacter massiliensis]
MRRDPRTAAGRLLLIIAAITYSGVPWELAAGTPLDPSSSYLSELAAADQPSGPLFRALDLTSGALILLALLITGALNRTRGVRRAAALALAAFALLTMLDALFPMACASSVSASCARADAANQLGLAHQIHTLSSSGAVAAAVGAVILLAICAAREPLRRSGGAKAAIIALAGVLAVVTAIVSVLALLSGSDGRLVDGGGFFQRIQVLLMSASLIAFALAALPAPAGGRDAAPRDGAPLDAGAARTASGS